VLGSPLPDRWTPEMRAFSRKLEQSEADELSSS
jgi:hypothetical protein